MRAAGASRSLELELRTSTQSSSEAPSSGQAVPRSTSVAPTSNSPLRKPSALNTSLVATGTRGLTITQGIFGRLSGSRGSPTPVMSQGRDARHTRTSGPVKARDFEQTFVFEPQIVEPRQQPQRRRGVGGPAANAGRHRQYFVQREIADLQ